MSTSDSNIPFEKLRLNLDLLRLIVSKRIILNKWDRGKCPFHEEDIPSFVIYEGKDRARYHCFGCGSTGDMFNYLQRIENISFGTAVMKARLLYINKSASLYLSPTEPPESTTKELNVKKLNTKKLNIPDSYTNCTLNCEHYQDLENDYRLMWEENNKFRVWLNLGPFISHNERKNTYDYL